MFIKEAAMNRLTSCQGKEGRTDIVGSIKEAFANKLAFCKGGEASVK
jgi:hypothetical protein